MVHPNVFLNQAEIDFIVSRKIFREPFKTWYNNLIKDANTSLTVPVQSVTYKESTPDSGDIHDYWTEGIYAGWCKKVKINGICTAVTNCSYSPCGKDYCDGHVNPCQSRKDKDALIILGQAILKLGLAYSFTRKQEYADKVVSFIDTWCINPSTKMNPKFTNNQSHIDLAYYMPSIFYGADLIWNYIGWNSISKNKFKTWVENIITDAQSWNRPNNWENWRHLFIASGAVLVDDITSFNYVVDKFKKVISQQMNADGSLKEELKRANSLSYHVYALKAMTELAEITQHQSTDLYRYKTTDNKGIELGLDFIAPSVVSPSKWRYQQIKPYKSGKGGNGELWELAYTQFKKPVYASAIRAGGRPRFDDIMGAISITHGIDLPL